MPANLAVTFIHGGAVGCEGAGTIPAGTQAIRVSLSANTGPSVGLKVFSGSTVVASGESGAGWGIDETVTVPVKRVPRAIAGARICTTVGPTVEPLQVNGLLVRTRAGARAVLLRMEYLRPGPRSWLSLAPSAARQMGLDRAPGGTWVAYLALAVMLIVAALATRLVIREAQARALVPAGRALRRIPQPPGRAR